MNALAAIAASVAANISLEQIVQGLESLKPVAGRLQMRKGINNSIVIDDTYNANPTSVHAAINVLHDFSGKRFLALGDMAELGHESTKLHTEVGEYALNKGIDLLCSFGVLSQSASSVLQAEGKGAHFSSKQALTESINTYIKQQLELQPSSNVTVLVKGSRSAKMELVVEQVINDNQQNNKAEPSC